MRKLILEKFISSLMLYNIEWKKKTQVIMTVGFVIFKKCKKNIKTCKI